MSVGAAISIVGRNIMADELDGVASEFGVAARQLINDTQMVAMGVGRAADLVPGQEFPALHGQLAVDEAHLRSEAEDTLSQLQSQHRTSNRLFSAMKILVLLFTVITLARVGAVIGIMPFRKNLRKRSRVLMLAWILNILMMFVTWLLAGVTYSTHTLFIDGCQAMQVYLERGRASSRSLDSVIPCVNTTRAEEVIFDARRSGSNIVTHLNEKLARGEHVCVDPALLGLVPMEGGTGAYLLGGGGGGQGGDTQGGAATVWPPGVLGVCDPFAGPMRTEVGEGEWITWCLFPAPWMFDIRNLSQVVDRAWCGVYQNDSAVHPPGPPHAGDCPPSVRSLCADIYVDLSTLIRAAASIMFTVLPAASRLLQCKYAADAYARIVHNRCDRLHDGARLVWQAYIIVGVGLVASTVAWAIEVVQCRAEHHCGLMQAQAEVQGTAITRGLKAASPYTGSVAGTSSEVGSVGEATEFVEHHACDSHDDVQGKREGPAVQMMDMNKQ
eukprot:jgi/Mesvir1/22569/Mv18573-RA.1